MSQSSNLIFNGGNIPAARGQSDWAETNPQAESYIKNKPDIDNLLEKNGDGKDVTVTFSEASDRTNITTGEKLSVLFGKIKKWFSDLKAMAFKDSVDLTQDVNGVLPISKGGTGGANAGEARTNLDVYSKSETDTLLNGKIVIAQTLPASGEAGKIYYVGPSGSGADLYEEYIWDDTNDAWIKTGERSLDLSNYLQKNGDGKDVTVTFTEASTRTNIASTESLSTLFGKIKKFFTDLASVAFTGSYNDLSNKPNLATVATTGDYSDLNNRPIFVAEYGSTTFADIDAAVISGARATICMKGIVTAILISYDSHKYIFSTSPDANGRFYIFTLYSDDSWRQERVEPIRVHDLICQLKPIVISGQTSMRYILCDRQKYTFAQGAYVFPPVDVFDLATWINRGDVIQIDGASAGDPWGDRYPMQITEMQCVVDSSTDKLYCSNIRVRGYAYSQTELSRWGDTIVDEASNIRYLEFQTWT